MRSLLKPLAGSALALMLVLSASPAQAFGPGPDEGATSEAPQHPSTQDPNAQDPGAQDPASEDPADGGEDPAGGGQDPETGEPSGPTDPADEQGDANAETPDGDPSGGADEPDATRDPAEETEPEESGPIAEAPEAIAIEGVVTVIPDEAGALSPGQFEAGETPESYAGGVAVATENLGFVAVDEANSSGDLEPGQQFSGAVELSAEAQQAVQERIDDEGALSEDEVAETASEALAAQGVLPLAAGIAVDASRSAFDAPVAEAAKTGSVRTVDIVYVGGSASANPTQAQLQKLVTDSGAYWKGQTGGKVGGFKAGAYKTLSKPKTCSTQGIYNLWNDATRAVRGKLDATPYTGGGRYLAVFANVECGGLAGLGLIQSMNAGGAIWIPLGARGSQPVTDLLMTTSHEFGHNLGLGHGDGRNCTQPAVDAPTSGSAGYPTGSTCYDSGYGDLWNVMGAYYIGYGKKPAALATPQKKMLGTAAGLREVKASGGASQTFTINAASATSGTRGLRVTSPSPGKTFFVEYRNGAGQDSGLQWSNGGLWGNSSVSVGTGVRVLKGYDARGTSNALRGVALAQWKGSTRQQVLRANDTLTPYGSTVRVRVLSASGSTAQVRIEYAPFIDVPFNQKFFKEIDWMRTSGLSTGIKVGDGTKRYAPKSAVTREAMAAFLFRMQAPKNYQAPKKSPFADVKPGQKFYKEITWMYQSKLSTGVKQKSGKPKYLPKASVSREAMAAFIYRLDKGAKPAAPTTSPFADVKKGQKFYKEISWMKQSGLSTGVKQKSGKPKYLPKASVSREAMAAFIYRLKH